MCGTTDIFLTLNAQGSSVLSVFGRCFSPKRMAAGSVPEGPLIGSPAVNANGLCRLKSVGVPARSDAIPLVIPALRAQSCPLEYPAGVLMDVLLDLPSDLNPTMDPSLDLLSPVEMTPKQSAEAAAEAAVGSSSFREAAESAMSGPVPSEAVSLGVEEGLRLSSAAVGGSFQEAAGEVTRAEVAAPVPSDRAATEGAARKAQECFVQELTRPMSDPVSAAVTLCATLCFVLQMRRYWFAWITELSGAVTSFCQTTCCTPVIPTLPLAIRSQVMPVDEWTYDTLDTP